MKKFSIKRIIIIFLLIVVFLITGWFYLITWHRTEVIALPFKLFGPGKVVERTFCAIGCPLETKETLRVYRNIYTEEQCIEIDGDPVILYGSWGNVFRGCSPKE